jgi:hypothetical protein
MHVSSKASSVPYYLISEEVCAQQNCEFSVAQWSIGSNAPIYVLDSIKVEPHLLSKKKTLHAFVNQHALLIPILACVHYPSSLPSETKSNADYRRYVQKVHAHVQLVDPRNGANDNII